MSHEHDDHSSHDHSHSHTEGRLEDRRKLLWVLGLTLVVMGVEVVGGLWSNSLALLSDAGHMLTDAASLLLAILALWIASRPADPKRTYGFFRLEVLSALINGVSLIVISGFVIYEAIIRLAEPRPIDTGLMLIVALVGLAANLVGIKLLSHSHSMNVRGAFLHVLGDTLSSVGVVIAALVARFTGWTLLDPILSLVIAVVIAFSAIRLIRQATHVLLEGVPEHIDLVQVYSVLKGLPDVSAVHDLHIWTISHGIYALSVHLVEARSGIDHEGLLTAAKGALREQFGVEHVTIQIETEAFARATEAEEAQSHGHSA